MRKMNDAQEERSNGDSHDFTQSSETPERIIIENNTNNIDLIDDGKFGWRNIKICMITGIGFFTVKYFK